MAWPAPNHLEMQGNAVLMETLAKLIVTATPFPDLSNEVL